MEECIFCRIAAGEVEASIVYEDDILCAFRDINPAAPTHILIIPKRHLSSLAEMTEEDEPLGGRLFTLARQIAEVVGVASSGYRLVLNVGKNAGQAVHHLHMHLLGGRRMAWPPG